MKRNDKPIPHRHDTVKWIPSDRQVEPQPEQPLENINDDLVTERFRLANWADPRVQEQLTDLVKSKGYRAEVAQHLLGVAAQQLRQLDDGPHDRPHDGPPPQPKR